MPSVGWVGQPSVLEDHFKVVDGGVGDQQRRLGAPASKSGRVPAGVYSTRVNICDIGHSSLLSGLLVWLGFRVLPSTRTVLAGRSGALCGPRMYGCT
jgi:hypothetical protein